MIIFTTINMTVLGQTCSLTLPQGCLKEISKNSLIPFNNIKTVYLKIRMCVPFTVEADFECCFMEEMKDTSQLNPKKKCYTKKYQKHNPSGFITSGALMIRFTFKIQ